MKNVLVIYYTQSGQLKEIASNISRPLAQQEGINLDFLEIEMETGFSFPWESEEFFSVFPDSYGQVAHPIKKIQQRILDTKYDLILLHYQVWYLSPSIPVTSLLKSPEVQGLFDGVPVVTISGSRNMWIMAQEKLKKLLKGVNANLVGNIALVDRASNLVSVITIVQWMFTGEKKRFLGIFPLPGVSDADVSGSERFGVEIAASLKDDKLDTLQERLVELGAVKIKPFLLSVDQKGNAIFKKWVAVIRKNKGKEKGLLKIFKYYLMVALYVVSPIVFLFHIITYPFWAYSFKKEKKYYEGVTI